MELVFELRRWVACLDYARDREVKFECLNIGIVGLIDPRLLHAADLYILT